MANMFNQMKDAYKMQREAKQVQDEMRQLKVTGESKKKQVKVYFNGAQEIEDIKIEDQLLDPDRHDDLVDQIKEAQKDFNKKLQKEMMKNFDLGKLKGMLGN